MIPRPKPETQLEQWLGERGHPFSLTDRKRIWYSYGLSEQYLPEKYDEAILNALKADAQAPEPELVSSGTFNAGEELEIRFPAETKPLNINSQLKADKLQVEPGNSVSLGTIEEPGICTARVIRNEGADDEIIRDLMVVLSKNPDQKFNAELVTAPRAQIEKPLSNKLRVEFTDHMSSGWEKLQYALTRDFGLIGTMAEYVAKKWAPENMVALSHTAIVCTVAFVPVAPLSAKRDCVVMGIGNGINALIDCLVFATKYLSNIDETSKKINEDEKKALETLFQGIKGAYEGVSLLVGGAKLRKKSSSDPDKLCDLAKLLVGSGTFATGLAQKTTDTGDDIQLTTGILGQSVNKTVDLICLKKSPSS